MEKVLPSAKYTIGPVSGCGAGRVHEKKVLVKSIKYFFVHNTGSQVFRCYYRTSLKYELLVLQAVEGSPVVFRLASGTVITDNCWSYK